MLDYGNWVPKKMLIAFLMLTLLFGGLTFLPVHIIVRVVFGILSVVFLLFLFYFYYSYHVFSVNGGAFRKRYSMSWWTSWYGTVKGIRLTLAQALRVVRKGGAFSFQDLFLNKWFYGEIDDLLETIREWEVEEVHFTNTANLVEIPRLLRVPWMLGKIGIIYGKK